MKLKNKKYLYFSVFMLVSFFIWTALVCTVDVKAVGPLESKVGFSAVNSFMHNLFGVHMTLYTLTDWLSIIPAFIIIGFGLLGFVQLVSRKSLLKVDKDILTLGGFYIIVLILYIIFEILVINYRPVLINDKLEASYPSSTTMLVMCVMPTAMMQFKKRIRNKTINKAVYVMTAVFTVFMVVCRMVSGVHWFSDIIGGLLVSCGLVALYYYFYEIQNK